MEALIGIVVGAVITWAVTWRYYRKAAEELSQETAELRRLTEFVLVGLENAGMIDLTRDTSGKVLGLNIIVKVGTASIGVRGHPPAVEQEPTERGDS